MSTEDNIPLTDAYDLATYSAEHGRWISALMRAIELDAKHNEGRKVAELASLGNILGDDLHGYMTGEAERIGKLGGLSREQRH